MQGIKANEGKTLFPEIPEPDKYRLLGNAVCSKLAYLAGTGMRRHFEREKHEWITASVGNFLLQAGEQATGLMTLAWLTLQETRIVSLARETIQNSLDARKTMTNRAGP